VTGDLAVLAGDLGDAIASFPLYKEKYGVQGSATNGECRRERGKSSRYRDYNTV
jgi:hypothetical protein